MRPKCGATAKSTGQACQRPALGNGRCYFHGGKTPAGSGWHKPVFTPGTTPSGTSRLDRKLHDLAQARKKRAAVLAKMTPAQREAHRKWHEMRQPGSREARLSRQVRKQQAIEARMALEASGLPDRGTEVMRLDELIRALQREADILTGEARHEAPSARSATEPATASSILTPDYTQGIF
jgi:hypothetical protein